MLSVFTLAQRLPRQDYRSAHAQMKGLRMDGVMVRTALQQSQCSGVLHRNDAVHVLSTLRCFLSPWVRGDDAANLHRRSGGVSTEWYTVLRFERQRSLGTRPQHGAVAFKHDVG